MPCCRATSGDRAPFNPLLPAHESAQKSFQVSSLLAVCGLIILPQIADNGVPLQKTAMPLASVVPIFILDCTFLL